MREFTFINEMIKDNDYIILSHPATGKKECNEYIIDIFTENNEALNPKKYNLIKNSVIQYLKKFLNKTLYAKDYKIKEFKTLSYQSDNHSEVELMKLFNDIMPVMFMNICYNKNKVSIYFPLNEFSKLLNTCNEKDELLAYFTLSGFISSDELSKL